MKLKNKSAGKIAFVLTGLASLIWFLIRVIPKPSRALYPCQRAAFPIAASFIIWLMGVFTSIKLWKRAMIKFHQLNILRAILLVIFCCVLFGLSYFLAPSYWLFANNISRDSKIAVLKSTAENSFNNIEATVAVVQSNKSNVTNIDSTDIQNLVQEAVNLAGGLDQLINDGDTVVIKPNLVCTYDYASYKTLAKGSNGIVTDYRVIQAVVNIVRELNPDGKIFLMEGSAIGKTLDNMQVLGWNQVSGVDEFIGIEDSSGGWYEYNSPYLQAVSLPDSIALYPDNLKPNKTRKIYLNKIYYKADVLISIPVLKNHFCTGITGAVKNVGIGATPGRIYGNGISDANPTQRWNGIDHNNRTNLNKWIHDFYACRPIDFVVMDGLQGTDRGPVAEGYSNLASAQKNMRLILAGSDPVAVDAIAALIMGHDPQKVAHLVYLHNDGLGCVNPACIEVKGESVEEIRTDFKIFDTGMTSKFSTFECNNYELKSILFTENELIITVTDSNKLARIELTVDGQKYDKYIIGGFDNISVPLDNFTISDSIINVKFVDKYLNTLEKSYTGSNITGINQRYSQLDFKVYPNPAINYINLEIPDELTGKFIIYIYNMEGKKIFSKKIVITDTEMKINIENLNRGTYKLILSHPVFEKNTTFIKIK